MGLVTATAGAAGLVLPGAPPQPPPGGQATPQAGREGLRTWVGEKLGQLLMTMDLVTTGQQRPHFAPLARPDHTRDGRDRGGSRHMTQPHSTKHRAWHAADRKRKVGG